MRLPTESEEQLLAVSAKNVEAFATVDFRFRALATVHSPIVCADLASDWQSRRDNFLSRRYSRSAESISSLPPSFWPKAFGCRFRLEGTSLPIQLETFNETLRHNISVPHPSRSQSVADLYIPCVIINLYAK